MGKWKSTLGFLLAKDEKCSIGPARPGDDGKPFRGMGSGGIASSQATVLVRYRTVGLLEVEDSDTVVERRSRERGMEHESSTRGEFLTATLGIFVTQGCCREASMLFCPRRRTHVVPCGRKPHAGCSRDRGRLVATTDREDLDKATGDDGRSSQCERGLGGGD